MKLKAYMVYPGESPADAGCVLCYAPTRNKARSYVMEHGPFNGSWGRAEYIDYTARRAPRWDEWADDNATTPYIIETNGELPTGAPAFFDDFTEVY